MVFGNAKDVKGPSRSMKDVNKLLVNVETITALHIKRAAHSLACKQNKSEITVKMFYLILIFFSD